MCLLFINIFLNCLSTTAAYLLYIDYIVKFNICSEYHLKTVYVFYCNCNIILFLILKLVIIITYVLSISREFVGAAREKYPLPRKFPLYRQWSFYKSVTWCQFTFFFLVDALYIYFEYFVL